MSLNKHISLQPTRQERVIPEAFDLLLERTGEVRDYTPDRNQEWELRASLTVRFWANTSQVRESTKVARRVLASRIYSDVLAEFPRLRLALFSDDREEALACMDRIDRFMAGE